MIYSAYCGIFFLFFLLLLNSYYIVFLYFVFCIYIYIHFIVQALEEISMALKSSISLSPFSGRAFKVDNTLLEDSRKS